MRLKKRLAIILACVCAVYTLCPVSVSRADELEDAQGPVSYTHLDVYKRQVYNGRREKDDTLKLALEIGEILQNQGIDVEYTRTTDVYETCLLYTSRCV